MSNVFVVDAERNPLNPVHPGRARRLLTEGKAAVLRRFPFTIMLMTALPQVQPAPLRLKIDPGSKTTGLAVVNDANGDVVWAGEVTHRGYEVKQHVDQRRACRRSRRQRHTRYRASRFDNRRRHEGWLPPSLESRVANIVTWVNRVRRWAPITSLSLELVKFDTQLLQNAEIRGIEYLQGELAGYEIREYVLEKWERRCAYCGTTGCRLEIEHIVPRCRGGSDRVSNLTIACHSCNQQKGNRTAAEFGYPELQAHAKIPLRDAAAVNTTRWAMYHRLEQTSMPVEVGSGGSTRWNRSQRGLPKTHWLDAACVGASTPAVLHWHRATPLVISATGWQRRQMCLVNEIGFPRTKPKVHSRVQGFKTGDLVRAVVPTRSKKVGTYVGKVAVRASGSFNVTTRTGTIEGISHRYCRAIQQVDGYCYQKGERPVLSLP